MKPWGSQPTFSNFLPVSDTSLSFSGSSGAPRTAPPGIELEASGGPGGGNEPPGRGMEARNPGTDVRFTRSPGCTPWGAIDYASCDAAAGLSLAPQAGQVTGGSEGAGPVISIRASPIRYGQPPETVA